jgi:hypothetical protein
MIGKRILIGAACLMAMQGAMAQVDGVTGTSVQTANTSCCKGKKQCCNTPAEQLKVRLQKLLNNIKQINIITTMEKVHTIFVSWLKQFGSFTYMIDTGKNPKRISAL